MTVQPNAARPWLYHAAGAALHPVAGPLVAAAVLFALYQLVGYVGAQVLVDFLENTFFGRWVNPTITQLAQGLPWLWLRDLLVGEYGLITMALTYAVAIILPIVGMFFLCFSILEDTGYLPRLAALCDRLCRLVGLNGKAVLPLMLGLGCGTMAVMSTRTLARKRDQILATVLLTLAVPCSAQLGVILAMLASLPVLAGWIWVGIVAASFIAAGQLASRLLGGEPSPFLYELPPLRLPKLSNILLKTGRRIQWYVREAVPLFMLGTATLFTLDRAGLLVHLQQAAQPMVVGWLGLPREAAGMLLLGFLRRDFGAAGLFAMSRAHLLSPSQILVSLVVITLFVPCLAQYLMTVKERGWVMGTAIAVLVVSYALLIGGALRWALQWVMPAWSGLL